MWSMTKLAEEPEDTKPEPGQEDAKNFCLSCEWACRCYTMNKAIHEEVNSRVRFVEDPNTWATFKQSLTGRFLEEYLSMSGEYTLLQFAKLHDPGRDLHENTNLSIEFFAGQKLWPGEKKQIKALTRRIRCFHEEYIREPRNKFFAHHDVKAFRKGYFEIIPECKFEKYMCDLGELATKIWQRWNCGAKCTDLDSQEVFDFSVEGEPRKQAREIGGKVVVDILAGFREH